jgi:sigma-E processing peptidase SpoIIGA
LKGYLKGAAMNVYIDELFIFNFIACLVMLTLYGSFMKLSRKPLRIFAAGISGALIAVIRFVTSGIIVTISAAAEVIVPMIAFRKISFRNILFFMLTKYAFSGLAVIAVSLFGGGAALIHGGIIYFDISAPLFATVFAVTYIFIYVFTKILKKHKNRRHYTLIVTRGSDKITLCALYDSGNLLKNPYDGSSVIIADKKSIDMTHDLKFMLIPFHAVGTESGMLKAFRADSVYCIETGNTVNNITIGISDEPLSESGSINALVGPGFFKEEMQNGVVRKLHKKIFQR